MSRVFRSKKTFWIAVPNKQLVAMAQDWKHLYPFPVHHDLDRRTYSWHWSHCTAWAFRFPVFESPLKDPREEHGGLRYSRRCAFPWMEWCLWIHGIRLNICSFCKALTTPDWCLSGGVGSRWSLVHTVACLEFKMEFAKVEGEGCFWHGPIP